MAGSNDSNDLNDETVVENLIDDAVVADTDTVGVRLPGHGHAARRSWGGGQEIDSGPHPLLFFSG